MSKIYHEHIENLSQNNLKIVDNIHSNTDIELANQLLAQAYLFLNTCEHNSLGFQKNRFLFSCHWCKGCEGCKSEDSYCSRYCLHNDDCALSKFLENLEKKFK